MGSHVERRAEEGEEDRLVYVVDYSGKAKIRYFDDTVVDEEVCWFDISVNNVILVDYLQSIANLHQNVLDLGLAETSSFRFDVSFKILLAVF